MIHFGVYIDTLSSYIFLEVFILYKNNAVIAHRLWEIYTCMNSPKRKLKILSNFVYSAILQ